jgi:hypothetical protein
MHVFDDPLKSTGSGEIFDKLLSDLSLPGVLEPSAQWRSEIDGIWMALAVLCPENYRQEFEKQRAAGHLDDYAIALQLRIPKKYVPLLFNPIFPIKIKALLK